MKFSMETERLIMKAREMSRETPYLFRVMLQPGNHKPVLVMEHAWYMEYRLKGYVTVAQIQNGERLPEERWEKERIA